MTEYDQIGGFSGIYFEIGDVRPSKQPSTLKTNIGKTFIEKEIPLRNTTDIVLEVSGVITGISRTSGQTQAQAIETDRDSLIALEDGYKHAYHDGRHGTRSSTINMVIVPRSLTWEDDANREPGQPHKFRFTLKEWK